MKKLAIILPELGGGGGEKVLLSIAKQLNAEGVFVEFLLIRRSGRLLSQLPPGIKATGLGGQDNRPFLVCCLLAFLKLLFLFRKNHNQFTYLSSLTGTNLLVMLANLISGRKCKVVLREAVTKNNQKIIWQRQLVKFLYKTASAIIAVSPDVEDDLKTFYAIRNIPIVTILNPVDLEHIRTKAKQPVDHPWINSNDIVFVGAGRLSPQKGFDTLIKAFALVRKKEISARLVIIGEGPLHEELLNLAIKLGISKDVYFTGFVENPYPWMARANSFILSSLYEGCANVLIEAMAVEAPLISTDCPGGSRLILDSGKRGTLVPINDAATLSEEMLKQSKQLITTGKNDAFLKTLSLEKITTSYSQILFN